MRKRDDEKLVVMQRKGERSALNLKLIDKVSNREIRRKISFMKAVEMCKRKNWQWADRI